MDRTFTVVVHCRDENMPTPVDAEHIAWAIAVNCGSKDAESVDVTDEETKEVASEPVA